jgi:hypothetical protein
VSRDIESPPDYIQAGVVQAILDAHNALDDLSPSVRACGATILLTMGTHGMFSSHGLISQYLPVASPSPQHPL